MRVPDSIHLVIADNGSTDGTSEFVDSLQGNDLHTLFKDYRVGLPGVDAFTKELVCIPCGWWLTLEDRERIVKAVQQYKP